MKTHIIKENQSYARSLMEASHKSVYMLSLLIFFSSFFFSDVFAVNKTFTGTGNFSDATKWTGSTLPMIGEDLIIDGTCTVDNNAGMDNISFGTLTIGTTTGRTLNWAAGGTNRLNISNLSAGAGASTLNMTNGGILIVRSTWASANLTFTPGSGTIEMQSTITLPAANATYNNLIINGSGITVSLAVATTVTGNLTITAGTFNANNFNCIVAGNWINNGGFTAGTGRVTFNGAGTHTVSGSATTSFNTITINKGTDYTSNILDVQSLITMSAGGLTVTNGTFKLSSASVITPFTANISSTPFLIPATAGIWCNGGTINTTVSMLWTVQGLIRISAGTLNQGLAVDDRLQPKTGASIIVEGGNMNCAARISNTPLVWSFIMTGGTLTIGTAGNSLSNLPVFHMDQLAHSFSMSGGTMIIERPGGSAGENLGYHNLSTGGSGFTGGTLQIGDASTPAGTTIKILTSRPIYNLTVNSANVTAQLDSFTVTTVSNNVTITAGTLDANNLDLAIGGNWTKASTASFTQGAGTVTFNGSSTQSINGTATSQTFNHVIITKTASTLLNSGGSTTTLTVNNFTETSGDFTAPSTLNVNGNLLLTEGTFTAGATTNKQGDWTNNGGTFIAGSNTVNFIGTGTKSLGGSNNSSFYNLNISTTAESDIVQLTHNITIASVLTLTKGVLDLNSKSLSVTSGLAGAITRTSGYILSEKTDNSSKVIWSIGSNLTSHTFPFGTASGSYIPFILNLTAGNIGNVTVSTYPTASDNIPYPSTPVSVTNMFGSNGLDNSANVVDRFWQINKDGPSGTATITFTATSAEVGSILIPTAQRYESSTNNWQQAIPGQTITATSATVPGVTTFSPWTMSSQAAMLPIQLVSFNAAYANPFVSLTWVTESELNSNYFIIERTTDEKTFKAVGEVKAAGQSIQTLNYQTSDMNPSPGLSYYRLKQVDFDGTTSYSDLVAIEIMTPAEQISVFPNPASDFLNVRIESQENASTIQIINMTGQIVMQKNLYNENGSHNQQLDIRELKPGMYYVIKSGNASVRGKFVKG